MCYRSSASVLLDMPLRDVSYGHDASIAIGNRLSEHTLAFEYPLAMVPERTMPKVREHLFRTIEPIVDGTIVVNLSAEATYGGLRMEYWVSHMPSCSVVSHSVYRSLGNG
jgi:hypothetical protein